MASIHLVLFVLSEGPSTVILCNTVRVFKTIKICTLPNTRHTVSFHSLYMTISIVFMICLLVILIFDLKNSLLTPVNEEDKLSQLHKLITGIFGLEFRTFV